MGFRIIWRKFATIANLATNQEPTLAELIPNIDPFPPFDDPIGLLYAKTEKKESLGGALKYIQR